MLALLAADWVTEGEVSADTLYYAGRNLADQLLPLDGVFSEDLTELADLLRVDTVPMLISIDALRAQYVLDHPDVSDLLSTYLSNSEGYLTGGAGWLGPDESEPLKDAYVWSPNATTTHPSVAQMVDVLGSTSLWTYDRWIQSWVNPDLDPPPMALDEILSRAAAADTQIHAILDWTYASATSQRESASSSESSRYVVFLVLTALLGAVALSAATGAVVSHRRRSRRRERVAATDHLTGAGNRALLQERTAAYMADPAFTSHLLAMIDLDRFKLINDTWGHGAGDAVLVAVAAGLQGVIDRLGSLDPDLVGTVIRFGGDEFVLSLHAKGMIDRVEVLRQLETLRCTEIDVGDSDRTTLSFSVGLAATRGPTELSDAMDAADLATYEDKAARARLFEERRTARSASPSDIALPPPPPPPMPPPPPTPPSTSTSPTQ
jgi:diguanylate cyclase (GGDEF)-like protein